MCKDSKLPKLLEGRYKTFVRDAKVPLNAKLCVHGIYPKNFLQASKQHIILDFGLFQARRAIALCWKSMDAPTLRMWIRELSNCAGKTNVHCQGQTKRLYQALGTIREYNDRRRCKTHVKKTCKHGGNYYYVL